MPTNGHQRAVPAVLAALAWTGLGLQLSLWLSSAEASSRTLASMLGQFFGYFTVETNLLLAVVMTCAALGTRRAWQPAAEAATAVYIAIVGAGYSLLLRHLVALHGAHKIADALLHDVVPLLYVLWWIFLAEKAMLSWRCGAGFLIAPIMYLIGTIIAGAKTGIYLYPFIDVAKLGYPRMLITSLVLLIIFVLLSSAAVAFSRRQAQNQLRSP